MSSHTLDSIRSLHSLATAPRPEPDTPDAIRARQAAWHRLRDEAAAIVGVLLGEVDYQRACYEAEAREHMATERVLRGVRASALRDGAAALEAFAAEIRAEGTTIANPAIAASATAQVCAETLREMADAAQKGPAE